MKAEKQWRSVVGTGAAVVLLCGSAAGSANIALLFRLAITAGRVWTGTSGSWGIVDPKLFFSRAVRQPFPRLRMIREERGESGS